MRLNVDRGELIAALTEKRDETAARVERKITRVQEMIDAVTPAETAEGWFREVADLLKDDKVRAEITPTMSSGRGRDDSVYLVVRNPNRQRKDDERVVPKFPHNNQNQITSLKRDLDHWTNQLDQVVEPYDAALKILNMSTDDKVGIKDGDYHGLLSGKTQRSHGLEFDEDEYEDTSLRP